MSDEYLVVWEGDDEGVTTPSPGLEIWARRVSPEGLILGDQQRISYMGPEGDTGFFARSPAVAHNPVTGGYLVVWSATSDDHGLAVPEADEEVEVYAQLLDSTAQPVGPRQRVSRFGPDGVKRYEARAADVVFNPASSEYLVVWEGHDSAAGAGAAEEEVYAQRVSAEGENLGPEIRVSITGPDGDRNFAAGNPSAAVSVDTGDYVVGWHAHSEEGNLEVFIQHLSRDGQLVDDAVRTSRTAAEGAPAVDALAPRVEIVAGSGRALSTWHHPDDEVYGQVVAWSREPRNGYWMLEQSGAVHPFGDAAAHGLAAALSAAAVGSDAVDLAPAVSGQGYFVAHADASVAAYGDAPPVPGPGPAALTVGEEVTTIASTSTGAGYWLFSNRGRALAIGDAPFYGDVSHLTLAGPVIDSAPTASGAGYWMLGADGGVFSFGDAEFYGSIPQVLRGGVTLNAPIVGMVPTPTGRGYWMVASDGGVFAFGDAPFVGSIPQVLPPGVQLNAPINGMVAFGNGYLMVASDGGVFNFSDKEFHGSLGDDPPPTPVVGIAPLDIS